MFYLFDLKFIQCTLSTWTTFYLEHLSVSNCFPGPLNIYTKHTSIFPFYLKSLYFNLTSLYLKQNFRSCCNYSRTIPVFLFARSVLQVIYRVSWENTVEFFQFEYVRDLGCEFQDVKQTVDLELHLKMWISRNSNSPCMV